MRSSCHNELDPDKIGVKVDINDSISIYEDKHVNAARKKDVHEFIDTIFCDWILISVNRFANLTFYIFQKF